MAKDYAQAFMLSPTITSSRYAKIPSVVLVRPCLQTFIYLPLDLRIAQMIQQNARRGDAPEPSDLTVESFPELAVY